MAEAVNRTRHGDIVKQALAGAVVEGEVVQLSDGRAGVAQAAFGAAVEGNYAITGVHDFLKDSITAFTLGEAVFWDVSENEATDQANADEAGVDFFLGNAEAVTLAGDATVRVNLRKGLGGAAFVVDGSDAGTTQTLANALKDIAIKNGDMEPL